ncbi:hypothetical protein FQR65_LT10652 [Abscondita terminalis]|nr:hypothetical protein FQR65_LT10652 [Abscondita terminalis]
MVSPTAVSGEIVPSKKGKTPSRLSRKPDIRAGAILNSKKMKTTMANAEHRSSSSESDDETDCLCIFCHSPYKDSRPDDGWIICQICTFWAHEECAKMSDDFICELCR